MFLSMNWIADFVDLTGLDRLDLIHRFSLSTAEVENEIFMKGSDLSNVVVAEIKSVEPHPDSKKLHLLKVDIGEENLVDVVCGAPNVRVGMKTAFAKVGAVLGEITITPRPLAGFMALTSKMFMQLTILYLRLTINLLQTALTFGVITELPVNLRLLQTDL